MDSTTQTTQHEIARRAYFNYLNRVKQGLPGNEQDDWIRAANEVSDRTDAPAPANSLNARPHLRKSLASAARKARATDVGQTDDLTQLSGIGPKIAGELESNGILTFSDLARFEPASFARVFPRHAARAKRYRWIEKARERSEAIPATT